MTQPDWEAILHETGDPGHPQIVVDGEFVLRAANVLAMDLLGWTYDDSYGVSAAERLHPDDMARALDSYGSAAAHAGHRPPAEFRLQHASGDYLSFDVSARSLPSLGAVLFTLQPIDARGGVEDLALENVAILETLSAGSGVRPPLELLVELGERHVEGSRWCLSATGSAAGTPVVVRSADLPISIVGAVAEATIETASALGEALRRQVSFTSPTAEVFDSRLETATAAFVETYPTLTATPAVDPTGSTVGMTVAFRRNRDVPSHAEYSIHTLAARLVALVVDWTDQRDRLIVAANRDALTELHNRRSLLVAIDTAESISDRRTVGVLDLDRFSDINNEHGHEAGDRLLRSVSERIRAAVPPGTEVFRTGGDEFTFVFPANLTGSELRHTGEAILGAIRQPSVVRGGELTVTGSLGLVVRTCTGLEPALRDADDTMYTAKRLGGDRLAVDDPTIDAERHAG